MLISRLFAAAALACGCLLAPVSLQAAPLTVADGRSADTAGDITGNPAGFLLAYARTKVDSGVDVSVRVRQHSTTGRPTGRELVLDRKPMALLDPIALPLATDKIAGLWIRGGEGIIGRTGDTRTGVMAAERPLMPQIAEAYMDAAVLPSGRIIVLAYRFDVSAGVTKRLAVSVVSSTLQPIAGPTFLPGTPANYVATAAQDFSVIALKSGGALVVHRNRTDGHVYAIPVSAAGRPAATATRISSASMPIGSGGQQTQFQVEAAQLVNGRVAVAWTRIGSTNADDAFDIRHRVIGANGAPVLPERGTAATREEQVAPEVVALPDGRFSVSWTNNGVAVDGRPRSYLVRHFNADGTPAIGQRRLYLGPRATNVEVAEYALSGPRLVLVRGVGTLPLTLDGLFTSF